MYAKDGRIMPQAVLLESISESNYLSADNYRVYRTIMCIFYLEHQKMHCQMDRDAVLLLLREQALFAQYTPEQLTVTLENLSIRTSGLSASPFHRIWEDLYKAEQLDDLPLREVNAWWQDLQEDFQRLSQNHQDFLREFYGPGMEMQMKSVDFICYKQNSVR